MPTEAEDKSQINVSTIERCCVPGDQPVVLWEKPKHHTQSF